MTDLPIPPDLPQLPNLTDLRNDAQRVVEYWTGVRDEAERRRELAQAYLDSTSSPNGRTGSPADPPSDAAVERVLTVLSNANGPRKTSGIAGDAGLSATYVNQVLRLSAQRGHVARERHHHGFRATITDAGRQWLARPKPGDAHHPAVRS